MIQNANLRVFRRNNKNVILLWSKTQMEKIYSDNITAFLIGEDGVERPLSFNKFVPDNPEKFNQDVDGIVIPHLPNSLDATKVYNFRIIFGTGSDNVAFDKQVLPVGLDRPVSETPAADAPMAVHMYGFDYEKRKWVPLPVDPKLFSK